MTLTLVTPPVAEPIAVEEAKAFARIETGDDDALVTALITGARQRVEAETGLALMTQTWRLSLDRPPDDRILRVPIGPIQTVEQVAVVDRAGATSLIAATDLELDLATGRIRLKTWPLPAVPALGGLQVTLRVGFGGVAAVPEPLKHAIRLLVAQAYDDRGDAASPDGRALPSAVVALLAPHRRRRL